ncbi:MAG TPA: hypothetical protein VJT32_17005 [bacterium]|nr:hypothetical protein [bacterium]
MSEQVLKQLQGLVAEAVEERRGLVVYSRLQPVEIDRMARRVERETIEKIRGLIPESTTDQQVMGLRNRLKRMREELEQLEGLAEIRDQSRLIQNDEIIWQAFEDIAWMLGIE